MKKKDTSACERYYPEFNKTINNNNYDDKNIIGFDRVSENEDKKSILELQAQCTEYSKILDMIGRLASDTDKNKVLKKVEDIFIEVMEAEDFCYWDTPDIPEDITSALKDNKTGYLLDKIENRIIMKVQQHDITFGVMDIRGFATPENLSRYLKYTKEITNILGLVLSNIEQYEILRKSENNLKYLSFHDALTGLYNRNYLNESYDIKEEAQSITVFMFDIDKLKDVNDIYGHTEGDKLINSFSKILKKCFREKDTVARIGGDEFLAIIHDCDEKTALVISERIRENIRTNNKNIKENHLILSVSMGYAVSKDKGEKLDDVIVRADEMMYIDKYSKKVK